jgi:hypothetical protein
MKKEISINSTGEKRKRICNSVLGTGNTSIDYNNMMSWLPFPC